MRYTVLSVAYPLTRVGVNAAGGSEQILTLLDRALREGGQRSLVLAAAGSEVAGELIESPAANGKLDDDIRRWGQQIHSQMIQEILEENHVDLIHMHSLDFHRYLPAGGPPVLSTLHLPPDWYPREIFEEKRAGYYLNCVSSTQERGCPKTGVLLPYIGNGVDIERYKIGRKKDYVTSLGRICPEKGFHFALEAAKKAGIAMYLGGEVFPYESHIRYFSEEIAVRLDGMRKFVGPMGAEGKAELLAGARCLLVPSTVQETSSLVAMEALASGTPVIAFRTGALPEIVEHGRTGYLVKDAEEMAEAIGAVGDLKAEECREAARTRFSAKEMARRYEATYREVISRAKFEEPCPVRPGTSWLAAW